MSNVKNFDKNHTKMFYKLTILCLSLTTVIMTIIGLNHLANTKVVATYVTDYLLVGSTLILQSNNTFIYKIWADTGFSPYLRGKWKLSNDTLQLDGKQCFTIITYSKKKIINCIEFNNDKFKVYNDSIVHISGDNKTSTMTRILKY